MTERRARVQDVIVGSGAGGGVLAARLAEAGRAVLVLEEGPTVDKGSFTQREGEMYPLLYRDAGSQLTADGSISVLQGRCLGGSTTINMGDCVPIEGAVLEHWRKNFAWGDWGGITDADGAAAQDVVMVEMGAGTIPEAQINRNNTLLRDGAAKVGVRGQPLRHNRVGCIGSGYCLIGCAYDAKRGTLVTFLPRARAAGADLWTGARVDRVTWNGRRATGVEGEGFHVEAERVFLCAGTVHTPGIVLRSGLRPPALGRFLTLQPQVPAVAVFPEPVDGHRGIPQSFGVDAHLRATPERGLSGFTLEAIAAGPAMTAAMLPLPMAELRPLLAKWRFAASCLCLVPDQPTGEVRWKAGAPRPKIEWALAESWWDVAREAVRLAGRAYLGMGALEFRPPSPVVPPMRTEADLRWLDAWQPRSSELLMISAHPQGTMRMAGEGQPRAVGLDCRLVGTDNAYVCDASLFPTSSSSHTMVPTMAMAHLLAAQLGG